MIKVGITGQSGFIGTHLNNYLRLENRNISLIPFSDEFFENKHVLEKWVSECDVVVHLAAINRHSDESVLYETNIRLVQLIVDSLKNKNHLPHIIFASSSQEFQDNIYGKSKKDGRNIFLKWAEEFNAPFTGMVIPNVFGPFGKPYYNSVVATFCHQLVTDELPHIKIDASLKLIYVGELVEEIFKVIKFTIVSEEYCIPHTREIKVSEILSLLDSYKAVYLNSGIIPDLTDAFNRNLFLTFCSFIDMKSRFPVFLDQKVDERGIFSEIARFNSGGQISFSFSKEGITRGNHFHTRKFERFTVIKGEALIRLRRLDKSEILSFYLNGNKPSYIDIPIWYTHNISNTGNDELLTIFWINEFFSEEDPDTFLENV